MLTPGSDRLTCSLCNIVCESVDSALKEHPVCLTYSCRFLHDSHAMFATTQLGSKHFIFTCILCGFTEEVKENPSQGLIAALEAHALNNHRFQTCEQAVFSDISEFEDHLEKSHWADLPRFRDPHLKPWQNLQLLERKNGKLLVRTVQTFTESLICASKHPAGTCAEIELD